MMSALGGQAAAEPRAAEWKRPVVHVCERGNFAEKMLKREHGAAPFATAAEVLRVADGEGQAWSTPRCMTELEHARLDAALRQRVEQRRAHSQAVQVLARR